MAPMEAHLRSRRQRAQLSVQRCTTAGRSRSSTPHFRRLPGHPCTISTRCCGRSNSYTLPLGRPASTSSSCSSFTFSSTPSFRISTSTGRYTTPSPFRHHQSPHHLPFRVHLVFIPRNPIYVLMISSRRILLSPFLWCPSLARSNTTHATTPPEFLQLQLLPALPDGHRLAQGSYERHSFKQAALFSPHYALKDKPHAASFFHSACCWATGSRSAGTARRGCRRRRSTSTSSSSPSSCPILCTSSSSSSSSTPSRTSSSSSTRAFLSTTRVCVCGDLGRTPANSTILGPMIRFVLYVACYGLAWRGTKKKKHEGKSSKHSCYGRFAPRCPL